MLLEKRAVVRPELRQFVEDLVCYDFSILGIHPVVGIAEGMDVAFRAGDLALRDFKNARLERCVQIPRSADLNFGVAALLDQRRQPADFKIASNENEQV